MESLPSPDPWHLASISPALATLQPDIPIWRVYRAGGRYPSRWNHVRHVGPVASRFDHHLGEIDAPSEQERGVYYCAPELRTAVAEFFQAARHVDLRSGTPRLTCWLARRPITLLNLWGSWVTRAGCDQGIHTSPARAVTRHWARAFYDAYPETSGLRYQSKMAGEISWCLTDRALDAFAETPLVDLPLDARRLRPALDAACASLGYSIDPAS